MADLNKKNPSVTEDALAIHLDSSGNIDGISGHGIAGTGGGGGSINYYGDDVYIKNTGSAGNIFTLTDSVKVKLDQIPTASYTQGTDIIIDENNTIQVNTNGNPNNTASNTRNFVEGSWTEASGYNSHAEGMATTAYGYAVHAQGMWTKFSSSKWSDTEHPTPVDIYWAAGAGATVEGYCNATTSCPMSGTVGQSDYGPIHGGIIKVIGNGNVVHDTSVDPDAHIHTLQPSDALIIYRDGSISAAGNISANGVELGAGGGGTTYQGRNGVNVVGEYVELTTTAYNSVTSVPNISNDVNTLKGASGDWNKVSDKLDTTAFSTVSGNFLTAHQSLDEYATKSELETASGELLTTAQYQNDSATFLTAVPDTYALKTDIPTTVAQLTDSGNYYQKTETSSKTELSTEFAKYVTSSNVTTQDTDYVMTTTGWKVLTLPGGGMTQVIHDETLTGQGNADNSKLGLSQTAYNALTSVSSKVDKPISLVDKYLALRTDSNGDVSGWIDLKDNFYSKSEATGTFVATANIDTTTLSGNGKTVNTKLGVNTDVIATKDYVNSSFLPLSGGTVSGDVVIKSTGTNILTVNTTATLMGQSRVNSLTDTTAIGTNWLGVNSLGGGFLKNVQGGEVGALNGTSIQINFAPDGTNSYGNITVNSQENESKVVHVPTASYTNMSTFDSENGPNYMLRKTANGFDIGAAVINTTALPENVQANAYYFIYEM